MYNPFEVSKLVEQARVGSMPPHGNLEEAQEVVGFSFGTIFGPDGQVASPGATNEALADFIVRHEVLRTKNMTLQEELAVAVERREHGLGEQIQTVRTVKAPGVAYNSAEIVASVAPGWVERQVGNLAVVAFRHHLPRADAHVRKAGFETAVPDLRMVGDFDPNSSQAHTRNRQAWITRERLVIGYCAIRNLI